MLTGADPFAGTDDLPYYTGLDWSTESQHVFRDNLRAAAMRLLAKGIGERDIVIDYAQFRQLCPDPLNDEGLAPVAGLFARSEHSLTESAVFWVRLVGYAYSCRDFVERHGASIGVPAPQLAVPRLVGAVQDPQIRAHVADYPATFDKVLGGGLTS